MLGQSPDARPPDNTPNESVGLPLVFISKLAKNLLLRPLSEALEGSESLVSWVQKRRQGDSVEPAGHARAPDAVTVGMVEVVSQVCPSPVPGTRSQGLTGHVLSHQNCPDTTDDTETPQDAESLRCVFPARTETILP